MRIKLQLKISFEHLEVILDLFAFGRSLVVALHLRLFLDLKVEETGSVLLRVFSQCVCLNEVGFDKLVQTKRGHLPFVALKIFVLFLLDKGSEVEICLRYVSA